MSVSLSLSLEQFHCFWYSRYFCNTRKTCTSRYFWTCRTISIRCMLHILFWIPAPAGPKIYISVVPDLVGHIKELPKIISNQKRHLIMLNIRVHAAVMGGWCNGQIIEPYSCSPFFMAYSTPKLKILVPISISSSSAFQRYPNFPILINY